MIHYITTEGIGNAWVANELRELERAHISYALHAMRLPQNTFHSADWAEAIGQKTRGLYPLPVAGLVWTLLVCPFLFRWQFFSAGWNACFGERESWRGRIATLAHFVVACHWARMLRHDEVDHIHSQWAHSCASIGMYGAWLLNRSFSFTGHACDLFRDRVALSDKIRRADFIVCISTFHRNFFLDNGARPEQLIVVYCGIDPTIFVAKKKSTADATKRPFRILSSCRLVEKKGLSYLIEACNLLSQEGLDFQCVIGGSGPLESDIREMIKEVDLTDRVKVTGKMLKQEDIPDFMDSGDVFCLPCIWASDGDVDGLPQMLMEAMACGLPVVSTRLVGIPDLVVDGETGLLVSPKNSAEIATALLQLYENHNLRCRLAASGSEYVLEKFDIRDCLTPLLDAYRNRLNASSSAKDRQLLVTAC